MESDMLRAFESFLVKKGVTKTQYVPYYVKWVADCYGFLEQPLSDRLNSEQRSGFLSHMGKSHEDWQVKQADTALRMYDYFLSRNEERGEGMSADQEEEWKNSEKRMRETLRLRQRSLNTEKTYLTWVRNFRAWVGKRSPASLKGEDLQDYLSHLSVEKRISPSTQNQALNVIVFFYRHVLDKKIDNEVSAVRAKHRRHLPVVLTAKEIQTIFEHLEGVSRLMAMLIYGCGLRLLEC
jgi:hypothetical protein